MFVAGLIFCRLLENGRTAPFASRKFVIISCRVAPLRKGHHTNSRVALQREQ
jgi:hypothetical protein